jgi:hypothetical protein
MSSGGAFSAAALSIAFLAACHDRAASTASEGGPATASAQTPPSAPVMRSTPNASMTTPRASRAAPEKAATLGCRVMSLIGQVSRGAANEVRVGDLLAGGAPLELAAGASVHLKHTKSAREWSVAGPGSVLVCADGDEDIVIGAGVLHTEQGPGARPGAQVLVGTPFGSVSYGDASARVTVRASGFELTVAAGDVWFAPATAQELTATHVTASKPLVLGPSARLAAAAAAQRCERDAAAAEARAKGLLATSNEPLGGRAAAHVRARRRAHASCADAEAVVLDASSGEDRERRLAELNAVALRWRVVPALAERD